MSRRELMQQLADLFKGAGEAHHQAFIEVDGEDPEWPLWYADYLREPLGELLDTEFTKSELVWAVVEADKEFQAEQEEDWPSFWADFFQDTYA